MAVKGLVRGWCAGASNPLSGSAGTAGGASTGIHLELTGCGRHGEWLRVTDYAY